MQPTFIRLTSLNNEDFYFININEIKGFYYSQYFKTTRIDIGAGEDDYYAVRETPHQIATQLALHDITTITVPTDQ